MQLIEFQQHSSSIAMRGRIRRFEANGPVEQLYRRGKALILGSMQRTLEQRRKLAAGFLLHPVILI
jgi:hypothetical protein